MRLDRGGGERSITEGRRSCLRGPAVHEGGDKASSRGGRPGRFGALGKAQGARPSASTRAATRGVSSYCQVPQAPRSLRLSRSSGFLWTLTARAACPQSNRGDRRRRRRSRNVSPETRGSSRRYRTRIGRFRTREETKGRTCASRAKGAQPRSDGDAAVYGARGARREACGLHREVDLSPCTVADRSRWNSRAAPVGRPGTSARGFGLRISGRATSRERERAPTWRRVQTSD